MHYWCEYSLFKINGLNTMIVMYILIIYIQKLFINSAFIIKQSYGISQGNQSVYSINILFSFLMGMLGVNVKDIYRKILQLTEESISFFGRKSFRLQSYCPRISIRCKI